MKSEYMAPEAMEVKLAIEEEILGTDADLDTTSIKEPDTVD